MSDIVQFVQDQESLFNDSLSDDKITWAKESQFAIQAFQSNDYLSKIAKQNLISVQNAIINVAAIGITLNPSSKLAYLVPRKGSICLDISYMGLLHIAMSTGSILWGQSKLVHANDTYESNGLSVAPTHKYNAFSDRGDVVGVYCTVKTCDGDFLTEEMSISEVNEIMARSESVKAGRSSPWKTDKGQMTRKTVIKRASSYWPKVDRLDSAIHYLNTDGNEGLNIEKPVTQGINDDQVLELVGLCRDAGIELDVFCKKASVQSINEISESRFEAAKGWILKQVKS